MHDVSQKENFEFFSILLGLETYVHGSSPGLSWGRTRENQ